MIPRPLRSTVGAIRYYTGEYGWPGGLVQLAGETYVRRTKSYQGRNVFDAEWDVLILLDACRVDLLTEVQDDYPFLEDVGTFPSLGSSTAEWMAATFDAVSPAQLRQTAYICANPFSRRFLDAADFHTLEEVWRYGWDDEFGTVPPRVVTDRTISLARTSTPDRILVHYVQPHVPFIGSEQSPELRVANFGGRQDAVVADDWTQIQRGERTLEAVWADYRENLRYVLDDVALLLENLEADRVVISSDHGNAAGEYGIYGHPDGLPIPCLREVPWVETSATDDGTHTPASYEKSSEAHVDSQLRALGYRSSPHGEH